MVGKFILISCFYFCNVFYVQLVDPEYIHCYLWNMLPMFFIFRSITLTYKNGFTLILYFLLFVTNSDQLSFINCLFDNHRISFLRIIFLFDKNSIYRIDDLLLLLLWSLWLLISLINVGIGFRRNHRVDNNSGWWIHIGIIHILVVIGSVNTSSHV